MAETENVKTEAEPAVADDQVQDRTEAATAVADDETQVQTEAAAAVDEDKTQVQTAEFGEAVESVQSPGENLNVLLDIQMPITVVLGNTQVPFRRLLQVAPGSVLALDKTVGQPADIYVQDIHLATGEVVVVGENYGIRIREVMGGGSVRKLHEAVKADSKTAIDKS